MLVDELLGYPVFATPLCGADITQVFDLKAGKVVLGQILDVPAECRYAILIHPDNDLNLLRQNQKVLDSIVFITAECIGGLQ